MTPLESYPILAQKIGLSGLYFKREDLHPYGSHKGRSIPPMIDYYSEKGDRAFAISGSGNAALAAAMHIRMRNKKSGIRDKESGMKNGVEQKLLSLDIFVGNHISEKKLEKLQKIVADNDSAGTSAGAGNIRILRKERPLQALTQAAQEGVRSLRQSTDDMALTGYESLAEELLENNKKDKIGAIFIGTSSGTTAQAIAQYFLAKKSPIQVHIVQTSSCHPMADGFAGYDGPQEVSLADAIVDQTAQRKSTLIPLIEASGGSGWIATNDDIVTAQDFTRECTSLEISTNSALSIAGAMMATYSGQVIDGAVVCMICGD